MNKKRTSQIESLARPKPLQYIPQAKAKIPTTTSEWFLFKGQNVYRQLTLNWGRKLVVGAFPFIAYFSVTFFDYRRTRYNFQLQQADFFKQSVACIANSPEVKEAFGTDIKLKRASYWTLASGFVPWIKERHVWLGFSSLRRDGWIRMGLRRTDFILDKESARLISSDIESGLKKDLQISLAKAKEVGESEGTNHEEVSSDEVRETTNLTVESSETATETTTELVLKETVENEANELNESPSIKEDTILKDSEKEVSQENNSDQNLSSDESEPSGSWKEDHSLTTQERIAEQVAEKETKDKLSHDQSQEYMAEMRRLYPTLPENFGQNDLEQAVALKKDKLLDGQIFNNTWDLLSLSIHPDKAGDGQTFVLWDPEKSYVDQADYFIDTAWLSIKKPGFMRASSVAVVDQSSTVAEAS